MSKNTKNDENSESTITFQFMFAMYRIIVLLLLAEMLHSILTNKSRTGPRTVRKHLAHNLAPVSSSHCDVMETYIVTLFRQIVIKWFTNSHMWVVCVFSPSSKS